MTIEEILQKEDATSNLINLYREGLFWKAYEYSAYRFVFGIVPYKPSKRAVVAIGADVISIEFPTTSLEKFAALFTILSRNDKQIVMEPKKSVETLPFQQWKEKIPLTKLKLEVIQEQPVIQKPPIIQEQSIKSQMPAGPLTINDRWEKMWDAYCRINKVEPEQSASYSIISYLSRAHTYRDKDDLENAHLYLEKARVCVEGLHEIFHTLYLQELALYEKQSLKNPMKPAHAEELSYDEILYRNLCDLMQSDKIYTLQIGRKALADMLQTNTTYVVEVIKRFSDGMTVTEFINGYRLRYAGKLLAERFDLSVEAIGEEAGFTSRSTYYRLFRDCYGVSPNEYRSISRNNNQ